MGGSAIWAKEVRQLEVKVVHGLTKYRQKR